MRACEIVNHICNSLKRCLRTTWLLPYSLSSFFTYLFLFTSLGVKKNFLTNLSTRSRIDLFRFQAGGRRRRLNVALVFWVHYVVMAKVDLYNALSQNLKCAVVYFVVDMLLWYLF